MSRHKQAVISAHGRLEIFRRAGLQQRLYHPVYIGIGNTCIVEAALRITRE